MISWRSVSLGCFGVAIVLAIATGGKDNLAKVQADFEKSQAYADAQDKAKTYLDNSKQEGELAWQMVQEKGCSPVIGLSPDVTVLRWVSVPLAVGQVATIGGKREQPFAAGSLVCDELGKVGQVGLGGRVENPIPGSQTPTALPVVPPENRDAFSKTLADMRSRPNMPQAVVSNLDELAARRAALESANPVSPEPSPTVPAAPSAPVPTPTPSPPVPQPAPSTAPTSAYPVFESKMAPSNLPTVNVN